MFKKNFSSIFKLKYSTLKTPLSFYKRKGLIFLLLFTSLMISGCSYNKNSLQGHDSEADLVKITFVEINDLHGNIYQDENGKMGLSNTAYLINTLSQFYNDNDDTTSDRDDLVLFANGDMFNDDTFGAPLITAMNEMKFDGMGIGNHEFNEGLEALLSYYTPPNEIYNNQYKAPNVTANFPLVSANIGLNNHLIADINNDDSIVTSLLTEKMGVKIGLIAVIGPLEKLIGSNLGDFYIADVIESVKNTAIELKANGAEIISVSIHYAGMADMLANINYNSEYLINIIFEGHSHQGYAQKIIRNDGVEVPVTQGESDNNAISVVTLTYNKSTNSIVSINNDIIHISQVNSNYDKTVERIISNYDINVTNN